MSIKVFIYFYYSRNLPFGDNDPHHDPNTLKQREIDKGRRTRSTGIVYDLDQFLIQFWGNGDLAGQPDGRVCDT